MRISGETPEHSPEHFVQDETVNTVYSDMEKAISESLNSKSLRDLVVNRK
jgi:hypothetical protein